MSEPIVNENPDTPNLRRLVRFAATWSDGALDFDYACFRDLCSDVEWKAFLRYLQARRSAPGWNPRQYKHGNHGAIEGEPWLAYNPKVSGRGRTAKVNREKLRTCQFCKISFRGRADASYCSPRCRLRAHRAASVPETPEVKRLSRSPTDQKTGP